MCSAYLENILSKLGRITASVEFQRLCERYEEQGLQVVRAALNCEDHIAVLLRKTRLQMYPLGVGLLGIYALRIPINH